MNNLNPTEQRLFDQLKKLKGDSIWQIAIHNVCVGKCADTFRSLVHQLKSQTIDEPEIMEKIIGAEAMQLLMAV